MVIYLYIAPGQGQMNPWGEFYFKNNKYMYCILEVFPFNDTVVNK